MKVYTERNANDEHSNRFSVWRRMNPATANPSASTPTDPESIPKYVLGHLSLRNTAGSKENQF